MVGALNRSETTCAFAVSAAISSEHSSIVLIGADSVSSLCGRADFALLCSSSLTMTDLNLCTHKLPTNFLSRRLQAKLSIGKHKIAESANIACT